MARHDVDVIVKNGKFWVDPRKGIRAKNGDELKLVNKTGLKWQVLTPRSGVLRRKSGGKDWRLFDIQAGQRKGRFPYQVYVFQDRQTGKAKRGFAEANSAPHIII
jgi:hypothetical protein